MAKEELPHFDSCDPVQFKRLCDYVASFRDKGVIKCEIHKVRSYDTDKQRAYYWAEVLPTGAYRVRHLWGEEDFNTFKMHEFFKDRYLKTLVVNKKGGSGEVMGEMTRSTMSLDTKEFTVYLEQCISFIRDFLGATVRPPSRNPKTRENANSGAEKPITAMPSQEEIDDIEAERLAGTPRGSH